MTKQSNIGLVGFPDAIFIQDLKNQMPLDQFRVDVIHPDEFLQIDTAQHDGYMICVTRDMHLRSQLIDHAGRYALPGFTYIHPTAVVFADAMIGLGCFVGPFAFVASLADIQDHCMINPYVMVSHRCQIGSGSVLHPGVMIAGTTKIGRNCRLNFKSAVLDHLELADFTEIGAGSMVTKIIQQSGFYVGTPARCVKSAS